jgi:hypothetical protein
MVWLFGHDVPWLAIIKSIGLHFPVRRDFVGAKLSIFCTLESFGVVCRAPKNDNRFNHLGSHWLGPSFSAY